jgi:hypothetical protein
MIEGRSPKPIGREAPLKLLSAEDDTKPARGEINRIGGLPVGVTLEAWPRFNEQPMVHVMTVDLRGTTLDLLPGVCAAALFVSSPEENQAVGPHAGESKVILLDASALARGEPLAAPDGVTMLASRAVRLAALSEPWDWDEPESRAYVGGTPSYFDAEMTELRPCEEMDGRFGTFLFQFDERVADVNMADGWFYVFEKTAWWET